VTGLLVVLPLLTAKFATFSLIQVGFDVSNQGVYVILPTGAIEVYGGCSGAVAMLQLLRLALLYFVVFPTRLNQRIWVRVLVPLVAILLAFSVNGFRVALLAVLAGSPSQKAFDYWHLGEGSHMFSMTSVLIFGLFCHFLLLQDDHQTKISST